MKSEAQVADGFGINLGETQLICSQLANELQLEAQALEKLTEELFKRLDTDANNLIDAIEMVCALAVASGMSAGVKLAFVLRCFDFDGTGRLSIDEITLALRCSLVGVCKLTLSGEVAPPTEDDLEVVAIRAITACQPTEKRRDIIQVRAAIPELVTFLLSDPETVSWLDCFDDVAELIEKEEEYEAHAYHIDYASDAAVTFKKQKAKGIAEMAALEGIPAAAESAQNQSESTNVKQIPELWTVTQSALTPTALANSKIETALPEAHLCLEWVHGYRGEDCRSNIGYASSGEIIYPAARLAIVYSPLEHLQRYMTLHNEEVLCLTVQDHIVATGDATGCVISWFSSSCEPITVIQDAHKGAVAQLAFGAEPALASVGAVDAMLLVHDWRSGVRLFSGSAFSKPLGICFFSAASSSSCSIGAVTQSAWNSGGLVVCGASEPYICFWHSEDIESNSKRLVPRRGVFGRRARRQPTLCAASCGTEVVLTGGVDGSLGVWHGRNCVQCIKAHRGSLNAIHVSSHGVVTVGKDGKLRLWSLGLKPGVILDCSNLGCGNGYTSLRAVSFSADGSRLLVGTGANEVFEVSAVDGSDALGGPVTSCHYKQEMRGLAPHPLKAEIASCGTDATVRIWDLVTRMPVRKSMLRAPATCCAYHPSGEIIAVGLAIKGENNPQETMGSFAILREPDLSMLLETQCSTLPLTVCKFSPNGEVLALGSQDCAIYLYSYVENYELLAVCKRHPAIVRCIDFSADSRWMRSGCDAGQLHFFNANSGQYQSNVSALRDLRWASESCLFAAGGAGARLRAQTDGAQLSACARARAPTDGAETGGGFVATGDTYGRILLERFPANQEGAYLQLCGHSGQVAQAVFNADETHLITAGATDKCIMQWLLTEDERKPEDADAVPSATPGEHIASSDYWAEFGDRISVLPDEDEDELSVDKKVEPYAKDPWFLTMSAPNQPAAVPLGAPSGTRLSLSRVFGYNCLTSRNNAYYAGSGIIYPAGCVLVRLELSSGVQILGTSAHAGREIAAVAVTSDGLTCATADVAEQPRIAIWNTLNIAAGPRLEIVEPHSKAITLLAFDNDDTGNGKHLASVGETSSTDKASMFGLAVHHTTSGRLLYYAPATTRLRPMDLAFGGASSAELCQVGQEHALYFSFAAGHAACRHAAISAARIGRRGKLQAFLSAAYLPDFSSVLGTEDGHLYLISSHSREFVRSVRAHEGAVYALDAAWRRKKEDSSYALVSGSRDGSVKLWSADLEMLAQLDNRGAGPVRSVHLSQDGTRILIGSQAAAELREFRCSDGAVIGEQLAGGGPAVGELWALSAHPTEQRVSVGSDEGALTTWQLDTPASQARVAATRLPGAIRCLAYTPDAKLLAAGIGGTARTAPLQWARLRTDIKNDESSTKSNKKSSTNVVDSGVIHILRTDTGSLVQQLSDAPREWTRDAKFSNDGKVFVAGSADGQLHVYKAESSATIYSHVANLTPAHEAAITNLDISLDGAYAQSADQARVLAYTDLNLGVKIPDPAFLRDTPWATWSSPLGWPVLGVHKLLTDQYEDENGALSITAVARSRSGKLLAVGDRFGTLRLLHFPAALNVGKACFLGRAHFGAVRKIEWTHSDQHLVSIGQYDKCVCVWRIVETEKEQALTMRISPQESVDIGLALDGGRALQQAVEEATKSTRKDAPWESALVPPSIVETEDFDRPRVDIRLHSAHGQRADDSRGNVGYNAQGQVVYAAGALGVIYEKRNNSQQFHIHHASSEISDISALAVSFDGRYAATGDQSLKPRLRIWDALTGATVAILPKHKQYNGILHLAFSKDGSHLAAIGGDKTYALYTSYSGKWHDATLLAYGPGPAEGRILCIAFAGAQNYPLAIGTEVQGIEFVKPAACGSLHRIELSASVATAVCAIASCSGENNSIPHILSGSTDGALCIWSDQELKERVAQAHQPGTPVYALAVVRNKYASAGADGMLKLWDSTLSLLQSIEMQRFRVLIPAAASLSWSANGKKLLVVARSGEMLEFAPDSDSSVLLDETHANTKRGASEAHGLDAHPLNPDIYATTGDDATVRIWSISKRACIQRSPPEILGGAACRCCAFAPTNGDRLAVGLGGDPSDRARDGTLTILQITDRRLEVLCEVRKSKKPICDIKWSADSKLLFVSSEDGRIYVHEGQDGYSLRSMCASANSPVTMIDISIDSSTIQAATASDELLFFSVQDGKRITLPAATRDTEWASVTVPFGWRVQGSWRKSKVESQPLYNAQQASDLAPRFMRSKRWRLQDNDAEPIAPAVTSIHRSHDSKLLAKGCIDGTVAIYNYPTQAPGLTMLPLPGHGSRISKVRFSCDSRYLLVLGQFNRTVTVYEVTPDLNLILDQPSSS